MGASMQADKEMIDDLIASEFGFDHMNHFLRLRAKEALGAVQEHFNNDFVRLEKSLDAAPLEKHIMKQASKDMTVRPRMFNDTLAASVKPTSPTRSGKETCKA